MIRNTLLVLFISFGSFVFSQQYSRVKINTDIEGLKQLSELGLPVDHGTYKLNTFFISDFSEYDIQKLIDNNFSYEILIADVQKYYVDQNLKPAAPAEKNVSCSNGSSVFNPAVPANFNYGSMGGYFTYQEMLDNLDAMAAQYPSLITARAPISTFLTIENRPIYHVKISDNALTDEIEPEVLHTAIHHAREPMSMSQTIFYMWYLLENYNTNDEVKYLVDNTEIFFVPCLNPDGYIYNETTNPAGGGMHRKNRRDIGTTNKGVDLNRNYSYGWGTTGVSFNVDDDTYPGTGAFSEAETQAMQWLVQNHTFITALNSHTYGNTLLYPVGTTTAEFADHNDYFVDLSHHMVFLNGYLDQKSSSLYPASGDSDDYMYKVDIGIGLKDTMFVMTPEVGSDFWPPQSEIFSTCQNMVFTNLIMSHVPHIYVVTDDSDPSTIETMTGNFNHSTFRLGLQDGPVTVSIEPLLNIQSVGSPIIHTLLLRETQAGAISYVLDPAVAFGDVIKYVLKTDNGLWTRRDTIVKTFGALTLQYTDDASTNVNWTGNWGTTLSTYVSPSSSFTESNTGNYPNNANKTYELNQTIDLTNVFAAGISYFAKWEIETDFDYCQFQVSTDNGISWIGQCGNYTVLGNSANGSVQPDLEPVYEGTQSSWVLEEINLSDYIGQIINVRFQLESDGGVRQDGFYYDDFKISYNLNPLGLDENSFVSLTNPNPANSYAYVSFSKVITNGKVELFDQNGKLVQSHLITEQTNKVLLNTETLLQGIYTVHVTDSNTISKPVKLVVVH